MKVSPLNSITAKLFLLVVLTVMGTVALFATKNAFDLEKLLKAQLKDLATNHAALSGRSIQEVLDNWESQLSTVLQATLQTNGDENRLELLREFLKSRTDFISLHVIEMTKDGSVSDIAFAFTPHEDSPRFGKSEPYDVAKTIRIHNNAIAGQYFKAESSRWIESLGNERLTGLPIVNLGKVFWIASIEAKYLVSLTAWQDPIIESLVESLEVQNFVVDAKGRVFSSRDDREILKSKSYKSFELIAAGLKSKQPEGFSDLYTSGKKTKRQWLGAYYRIPQFNLLVVAQRDRAKAYAEINESIMTAVKWGGMFLLIAILISYFGAEGVTKKVKLVTKATQLIAHGNFNVRLGIRSNDEVGILSKSVDTMAERIQLLLRDQVRQAERDRDLETARAVQETLFPKIKRTQEILKVSGYSIPASETGGDWWGHYSTGDGIEYVFIADAMGHGVPAALVTAVAYSSCMTLAHMLAESNLIYSPAEILQRVNRVLYDAVEGSISMTFFALMVDYHEGKITYANAGHNFPLLIPSDPDDDRIGKKIKSLTGISPLTPLSLRASGTILGVEKDCVFEEKTMALRAGDKFFLFTDGLIECKSPEGGMWGRKVLLEKVMTYIDLEPEELLTKVRDDAFSFFKDVPRDDDLTVVVLEFPKDARIGGYRQNNVQPIEKALASLSHQMLPSGQSIDDAFDTSGENPFLKPGILLDLNEYFANVETPPVATTMRFEETISHILIDQKNDPEAISSTSIPPPPPSLTQQSLEITKGAGDNQDLEPPSLHFDFAGEELDLDVSSKNDPIYEKPDVPMQPPLPRGARAGDKSSRENEAENEDDDQDLVFTLGA